MTVLLSLAKTFLIPGSAWFLVTGIGLALLLLSRERTFAWGRRWLAALFLLYVALSVPLVSDWLDRSLSSARPIADATEAQGAATMVLLGNGAITVGRMGTDIDLPGLNTALNISEAARLYRLLGGRRIIASGGIPPGSVARRPESEVMRDYLLRLGIPDRDIVLESASVNTIEQARHVAALVPAGSRVLLVTAPSHLPRAVALFRGRGLDVVPAVSASRPQPTGSWSSRLLPDRFALRSSEMACYELLALAFYWLRGDIAG
jgi:uncharacterized SAM-binding protein YcdF (DUF218 family)